MALTNEDKELITLLMQGHTARIESSYDIIDSKLDGINERLDKINGRINKHDEQIQEALIERSRFREEYKSNNTNHVLNCPVAPKVRILEDNALSSKAVKGWLYLSVGVTAAVITVIFTLFKLITGSV